MKLTWIRGEVPEDIQIRQVYGVLFNHDGRILLMVKNKQNNQVYSLSGGTCEDFDDSMIATLRRELIEEINTTIQTPQMLGYQLVDEENGKPPYAQVRMTAMIDRIGDKQPDPDNGEIYDRILTHPSHGITYLNWGDIGKAIIEEAVEIAKDKFGLTFFLDKDELV